MISCENTRFLYREFTGGVVDDYAFSCIYGHFRDRQGQHRWNLNRSDAVIVDAKPLLPYAVDLLSIEHFNLLNQFVQHPGCQFSRSGVLTDNLPYVFIALFATKLGQAARLAPGADFSQKSLHIMEGFAAAFQSALPSFHPIDLCVGVAAALLIRLAVYVKGKNARKFRKNIEYGSARWSA